MFSTELKRCHDLCICLFCFLVCFVLLWWFLSVFSLFSGGFSRICSSALPHPPEPVLCYHNLPPITSSAPVHTVSVDHCALHPTWFASLSLWVLLFCTFFLPRQPFVCLILLNLLIYELLVLLCMGLISLTWHLHGFLWGIHSSHSFIAGDLYP